MEDEIMETWDKVGNNVEGKTDFLFDGLAWSNDKVIKNYDVIMTSSLRHIFRIGYQCSMVLLILVLNMLMEWENKGAFQTLMQKIFFAS